MTVVEIITIYQKTNVNSNPPNAESTNFYQNFEKRNKYTRTRFSKFLVPKLTIP